MQFAQIMIFIMRNFYKYSRKNLMKINLTLYSHTQYLHCAFWIKIELILNMCAYNEL